MKLLQKNRVNIVITNRVLRYSLHKSSYPEGLLDKGELNLPHEVIKDGAIVNRAAFLKAVSTLVKKKNWKGKPLYFCLPDDSVVIRNLQIPAVLTEEESLHYVSTQLGHSFYLPFANPSLAIEFLEEENQLRNILLYAYPNEKIVAFEEVFRQAGLKPVVADLTSLSVYRLYYKRIRMEHDHVLHIQWNTDALVVTAFQNHKAIFTRYIKVTVSERQEEMTEQSTERLMNEYLIEVRRIIDFYQFSISKGQASINLVLLSGDVPYLPRIWKSLRETLPMEVLTFTDIVQEVKYVDVLGLALKQEV